MLYDEKQLYNEGFNQNQVEEIVDGQMAGVDVSAYDKKNFLAVQMRQVRLGLIDGLDVSEYAHDFYDWFQMEEIRKGLLAGIDVTKYAAPSITYERMRQMREALMEGIDLSPYRKLDAKRLQLLRDALRDGYDITEYIEAGYAASELEQICAAIREGLDIRPYLHICMCANAIQEIVCGLRDRLDVTRYMDENLNWRQMREIRLGLSHRIDVSQYCDALYTWKQMQELRLGLEEGLDLARYRSFIYSDVAMRRIRESMLRAFCQPGKIPAAPTISQGSFAVVVSEDALKAYLFVRDNVPDETAVRKALQEQGIVYGICEEAFERLSSQMPLSEPLVLAEGIAPTRGADGWYEYFFDTKRQEQCRLLEDGTADYSGVKWFTKVKEGQKLATYHDAECGSSGCTVTGRPLHGLYGKEKSVLTGSGISLMDDLRTYVASIDGRAQLEGTILSVTKLLVIDHLSLLDVKVVFDGTVYVRGGVESGTSIRAKDEIIVDGLVENAQLSAGGSILLRGGVRGAERIYAKHDVAASFLQNALVVAEGNIQAIESRGSRLYAGGQIHMIGSVVGGIAQAQLRVIVGSAGDLNDTPTVLRCELLESVKEKGRALEDERIAVGREIEMLTNSLADYDQMYPPQVRNAMEVYIKISNAIYIKKKQMQDILDRRTELWRLKENVNRSEILVDNKVYPGVEAEISDLVWQADHQERVRIRKEGNQILLDTVSRKERERG